MLDLKARTLPTHTANTLDILSSKLGSSLPIGISQILDQIGATGLQSLYETGSHKWNLSEHSAATVKLSEQIIRDKEPGLVWLETKGQVDLSLLNSASIPLGSLSCVSAGYRFDTQVNIRRREPYHSPSGSLPKGACIEHAIQLPVTAALASELPVGSEFELSALGTGAFRLSYYLGVQNSEKTSLTLLTRKLPEPGKVSVKFTRGYQSENSIGYKKESDTPDISVLGRIGRQILSYFGWLKWFGSAFFIFEAGKQNQTDSFTQFEFDLSNPEHAEAFEDIFFKCSTGKAIELGLGESGTENESGYSFGSGFELADWNLSFFRVRESEKQTQIGTQIYQHFHTAQEYLSSWFSKARLAWEWKSIEGPDKRSKDASCRLNLDTSNASDFFEITQALGIPVLENARQTFLDNFGTEVHVDVQLTHEGIRKIQLSSFKEAFYAYLNENGSLIKDFEAAYQYGQLLNKPWLIRWWYGSEIKSLENKHPELSRLSTEIQTAYWFGRNTHPFKGSLKRFSNTECIAAIMRLAGSENVIIEDLSIARPGMSMATPKLPT